MSVRARVIFDFDDATPDVLTGVVLNTVGDNQQLVAGPENVGLDSLISVLPYSFRAGLADALDVISSAQTDLIDVQLAVVNQAQDEAAAAAQDRDQMVAARDLLVAKAAELRAP